MSPRKPPAARNDAWFRRQEIWRHNSFFGHVAMARQNMIGIMTSKTATDEAKAHATTIYNLLERLRVSLAKRVEGT